MNCDPCSDLHSPSTSTFWSSNFRSCELLVHMTYPQSRYHFFQTHWWNVFLHFIPVFVFLCSNCLTSSSQRFWLEEDTESFVLYYFCLSNDNACPWRRGECVLEQRNAPSTAGHFLLGICPLICFFRDQLSSDNQHKLGSLESPSRSRVILLFLFYSGIPRSPNLCEMVWDDFSCVTTFVKSLFFPYIHSDAGEAEEYYYLNNSVSNRNYKHLLQDGKYSFPVNSIPLR